MPYTLSRPDVGESKQRLIVAAESLFAQKGIGGASLREVAECAGMSNNVSVQYHFGSREGLIEAIVKFRMWEMEEPRGKFMKQLNLGGYERDPRSLLEAALLPHLDIKDEHGTHPYAAFLLHYMLYSSSGSVAIFETFVAPEIRRITRLLRESIPFIAADVFDRRYGIVTVSFLSTIVMHDHAKLRNEHSLDISMLVNEILDHMVVLMCMPQLNRSESVSDWPGKSEFPMA